MKQYINNYKMFVNENFSGDQEYSEYDPAADYYFHLVGQYLSTRLGVDVKYEGFEITDKWKERREVHFLLNNKDKLHIIHDIHRDGTTTKPWTTVYWNTFGDELGRMPIWNIQDYDLEEGKPTGDFDDGAKEYAKNIEKAIEHWVYTPIHHQDS